MNFVPNDNSEDEFLCVWFVVSFIYVLHGNINIFIVIVIVIVNLHGAIELTLDVLGD